jgi:NAD(P)-dependent dehydrogenase (short-subunit alcohol dehydrogenase family)
MDTWGLGSRIKEYLLGKGQSVYTVVLADHYEREDLCSFVIDATKPEDYTKLFRELGDFAHPSLNIVHLGCISDSSESIAEEQERSSQDRGFFSLLFTAQSIGDLAISPRIRLGVISNGIHQVTGEEKLYPGKATILGPCGVIPKEYSNISCFSVDVVLPISSDELAEDLPDKLATEFTLNQGNPVIAYRGMFRWVREFEQLKLQRPEPNGSLGEERNMMRLRKRGIYLITGGTGGIGLTIAKHLAERYQARLVFTQRSEFPDKSAWHGWLAGHGGDDITSRKIRQIMELEELGAEVIVYTADAADKDRMGCVIEETRAKLGQINGVIHAAGIIRAGIIQAKTLETVENVMSPKVTGTLVLSDLLKDASLDFFVLFSSVTSILAPYAEVEYSAANAFLDAFADYANRTNRFHTLTINWPGWREVGQLAELKTLPGVEEWKKQALIRAILPTDGLEAFIRALSTDLSQIIVSPENLVSLYVQSINLTDISTTYAKAVNVPQIERGSERLGKNPDPPTNEVEEAVTRVWTEVLGVDPIGVHENFAELGGHSLLAMQIVTRLRDIYQVDLTLRLMLGNPTIAQLGSRIKDAVISDIEKLSDEEARQMVSGGTDRRNQST